MTQMIQIRCSKLSTQFSVPTKTRTNTIIRIKRRKTAAISYNPILALDDCYEILLRVDPSCLFKFILVSKEWLKIITGAEFRQTYQKRWGNNSKLVGFLKHGKRVDQLLAASRLGRTMKEEHSVRLLDDFVCKSGAGDGLVLSYIFPKKTFCVSKPIAGEYQPSFLVPPKDHIPEAAMAIISNSSSDSYKVIRAEANLTPERSTIRIQTYSSSTGEWKTSILSRSKEFTLKPDPGIVTGNGVVYFRAVSEYNLDCLAAYEPDNGRVISLLYGPELEAEKDILNYHKIFLGTQIIDGEPLSEARSSRSYGLCKNGRLRCATREFGNYSRSSNDETIKIWGLDEDNQRDWNLLYRVDPTPVLTLTPAEPVVVSGGSRRTRSKAAAVAAADSRRAQRLVGFVSFVPGRSDSVYLTRKNELFVYNLDTCLVEKVDYQFEESSFRNYTDLVPLTMAELGVWPSCPLLANY